MFILIVDLYKSKLGAHRPLRIAWLSKCSR